MADSLHDIRFPGESDAYRTARDELLRAEMDLRKRIETLAELRRKLPLGGELKEDYVFREGAADLLDSKTQTDVKLSQLFEDGKDSLILYSFMYAPKDERPCPMCTSMLDGLDGLSPHVRDRVNLAVVAKSPVERIRDWARSRGWTHFRLLSSENNSYNADYHGESASGSQNPAFNVFVRRDGAIHHFYNTELLYAKADEGQHMRHNDLMWPLWSLFDLTPDGRGTEWFPKLSYE